MTDFTKIPPAEASRPRQSGPEREPFGGATITSVVVCLVILLAAIVNHYLSQQ
jgi:hypothetical protein